MRETDAQVCHLPDLSECFPCFWHLALAIHKKFARACAPLLSSPLVTMLATIACALLSFAPLEAPIRTRREAVGAILGGALVTAVPLPAFAQRSALVPKSSAESTASFKAYQLSKPGEATPEFLAAEKKRAEREAGVRKPETAEEQMSRLGLKTMNQAVAEGYDECKTWRGCNRN